MTWIRTIPYAEARGRLKRLYDRIKGPDDAIDNIMLAHGLRPPSLEGHMALYKNVLHHSGNRLPKWLSEAIGLYVSLLNGCAYCVAHHAEGMRRRLGDEDRARAIREALEAGAPEAVLEGRELALMAYARALTEAPAALTEEAVAALRAAGLDDGEILEANQVVAYFAYANRTVQGLGVTTEGDVLGLSPGAGESDDWGHE
jgi:uncharacterized peroxidase-related enzyme